MPERQIGAVMTIDKLSEYIEVSKSTLYELCSERRFPGRKVGRHWRFHREAVDAWFKCDGPRGN